MKRPPSSVATVTTSPTDLETQADHFKGTGRAVESAATLRRALALAPGCAEIHFKLGSLLHDQRRWTDALGSYLTAIRLKEGFVEALYNAGLIFQAIHQPHRAIECYRHVLKWKPDSAEALNNLGRIHLDLGKTNQAVEYLRKAQRQPVFPPEVHLNLAEAMCRTDRCAEAEAHYESALNINPTMAEAWNNLGNIRRSRHALESAITAYRRAVQLRPDLAEAHYNLGSALKDAERDAEAEAYLRSALELRPAYAEAWNNLGLVHKNRGEVEPARNAFTRALQAMPDMPEAHWNRAFVNLLIGNFSEGWKDYEWRYRLPRSDWAYPFRHTSPRWDGKPDLSKTILVHDEQGLGDTLQFIRYLPWVRECCGRVILETQRDLIDLVRDCPGIDAVVERPAKDVSPAAADCHVPLLSLPSIFGTTLETVPSVVPYLWADPRKACAWQKRLSGPAFKVGIVWAGRPQHQNDKNRSCGLEMFRAVSRMEGLRLFSLQKGPAVSQIQDCALQDSIENLDPELNDFTDTAAVIANLDLVISVDTSVAHLAGAMARPVWLLLPFIPDWRWLLDREDSPWYPTMRLFRQAEEKDWLSVFRILQNELKVRGSTGSTEN